MGTGSKRKRSPAAAQQPSHTIAPIEPPTKPLLEPLTQTHSQPTSRTITLIKKRRRIASKENPHYTRNNSRESRSLVGDKSRKAVLNSPLSSQVTPDPRTSSSTCLRTHYSTSSPLPLTYANLQTFNGGQTMPPITPSKTSTSASAKPNNIGGIRRVLYDNNLMIEDDEAFERCSGIKDAALEIIQGDRNSGMQPGSRDEIQEVRKIFATGNEFTFLVELWAILLHKTRDVRQLDPQGKIGWIKQAWRKDYLRTNWGADFLRDSVPAIKKPDDKVLAKLLESLPRIQNPRPDLTYGLRQEAFGETERRIIHTWNKFTVLSADLYQAFFLVEVKSAEGTIEDAENQCCRGGAALVHARRQFNAKATLDDDDENLPLVGADLRSFAFSLALVPSKAHMFVHWAEVKEKDVRYHMNLVNSYDFRALSGDAFEHLRHDIDNVLDWGTLKRKREITGVCEEIARRANEDTDDDVEGASKPPASKKRKQNGGGKG